MLWLPVAQGVARCVRAEAERLRPVFVSHEGTETLIVRRDDFVKGSPENPWMGVFSEFSAAIRKHVGEANHCRLVAAFSTTGPVERAANEVVLMDARGSYFEYVVVTRCGIPEVRLEGEAADWASLRDRVEDVGTAYGLGWWTDRLRPTFARIAENAAGADDPGLWRDIYKLNGMSGGPYLTGWLLDFFPYPQETGSFDASTGERLDWTDVFDRRREDVREAKIDVRNRTFEAAGGDCHVTLTNLPGGLSRVPFRWEYLARTYGMEFLAGFVGFTQDRSLAVRPKIGWAVRDARGEAGEAPGRDAG